MNNDKDISLYPLIFEPILKDKIWGGEKLQTILNKDCGTSKNCGESWELSDVEGNSSIVTNGVLKGTSLSELLKLYPNQLLGESVHNIYRNKFPLLVKFIDANQDLSIQVHPGDELAKKRHNCPGKTEMWYLVDADKDTELIAGFSKKTNQKEYLDHLKGNSLDLLLNKEKVAKGDVFYIPAGRVHTIGKGCLIAEIQQTSDVTYRIYDFDRKDKDGYLRELHTEQALDAIDYNYYENYKTSYPNTLNNSVNLVEDKYFTTNKLTFDKTVVRNYSTLDSFVIYTCVDGNFTLSTQDFSMELTKGEVVLIPSIIKEVQVTPTSSTTSILETYIP